MSKSLHQNIHLVLLLAALATMLFWQWLSSVFIILLTLHWIIEGNYDYKFSKLKSSPLLWPMIAFFLLHILYIPFSDSFEESWFETEKKLSFLVFPIICGSRNYGENDRMKLLSGWIVAVSLVAVYCMTQAFLDFIATGQPHYLYDFQLSAYSNLHAGYFSVYVITAIAFSFQVLEKGELKDSYRLLVIFISSVLVFFLVLLSSKLIVSVGLLVVFWYLLQKLQGRFRIIGGITTLAIMVFVYFIPSPLDRGVINPGNIDQEIKSTKNISEPEDGLTVRINLWSSGIQLLNTKNAWIFGLGPVHASELLREQLLEAECFMSKLVKDQPGKSFNLHNQFMETLIRFGIPGLIILMMIVFSGLYIGFKTNSLLVTSISAIFLVFFFSESALERQMGVVPYAIFLSLILSEYYSNSIKDRPAPNNSNAGDSASR